MFIAMLMIQLSCGSAASGSQRTKLSEHIEFHQRTFEIIEMKRLVPWVMMDLGLLAEITEQTDIDTRATTKHLNCVVNSQGCRGGFHTGFDTSVK